MSDIVIPANVEVVFEEYCRSCKQCEILITQHADKQRIICNNSQICQRIRSMIAKEKSRSY